MDCSFTEKISSLIDGELSPAEAREVERHLLACEHCADARADFLNLRRQISDVEAALPAEVHNQALAKILAAGRSKPAASSVRPAWGWNWGYGALAFASIAILALIIGLNFYRQPPPVVAIRDSAPAPSPAAPSPSPSVIPSQEPEPQKPETPPRQQPAPAPRRAAPVREPKPGEKFAVVPPNVRPVTPERVRSADAQTMTALHFERAETLLRAFRNVRLDDPDAAAEVRYERARAKQLIYQNMLLRREADAAGEIQIASLLDSLEPILLDIANLPDTPDDDAVRVIRERVERKNIVGLLQVNSTALARALD